MHPVLFAEIPWMLMSRLFVCSALIGMTGFLAGCGGGSTVPKLAPASGTITMDGAPAAGVTVSFNPAGSNKATGGMGVSGADGKYKILHRSGEAGVEPGSYSVTFSRMVQPDGSPVPAGTNPLDVSGVESIPATFTEKAEVPPEGGSAFDFTIPAPKK
jgi:hypothetical protein